MFTETWEIRILAVVVLLMTVGTFSYAVFGDITTQVQVCEKVTSVTPSPSGFPGAYIIGTESGATFRWEKLSSGTRIKPALNKLHEYKLTKDGMDAEYILPVRSCS